MEKNTGWVNIEMKLVVGIKLNIFRKISSDYWKAINWSVANHLNTIFKNSIMGPVDYYGVIAPGTDFQG